MKKLISIVLTGTMAFATLPFASISASAANATSENGIYNFSVEPPQATEKEITSAQYSCETTLDFICSENTYFFNMRDLSFDVTFSDGTTAKFINDIGYIFRSFELDIKNSLSYECEVDTKTNIATFYLYGANQSDTASVDVPVNICEVKSMEIINPPNKTEYVANQETSPKLNRLEVKLNFVNGSDKTFTSVNYSNAPFPFDIYYGTDKVSGTSSAPFIPKTGESELTLVFGNSSASFKINAKAVKSFEITKQPSKTIYLTNEEVSLYDITEGMEALAKYEDGTSETIEGYDLYRYIITEGEYSVIITEGNNKFTVSYGGITDTFCVRGTSDAIRGDISNDGILDVKDVTDLQMYLANYENYVNADAIDVNFDGRTDVADVTTLQMILAGYDV